MFLHVTKPYHYPRPYVSAMALERNLKKTNYWIIGAFSLTLIIYLSSAAFTSLFADAGFWDWRGQFVVLSGVGSIVFMSLATIIAARPAWVDRAMGGLDKAYGLHKWIGIAATVIVCLHWFGERGVKWMAGWGWLPERIKAPAAPIPAWESFLIESGKLAGEWTFYIMLVLVVIALFQAIPYRWFRYSHKVFPVLFIAGAFHAVTMQFKTGWWTTPAAWIILTLCLLATAAALIALTQQIGRSRRHSAVIESIERSDNDILDIRLNLKDSGLTHAPGQFAFVTFEHDPEPHPFTIASSGDDPTSIRFAIKPLGDYTAKLASQLHVGCKAVIEGPYGQFRFDRPGQRQIWVGGGIGVTPFMSRLESLARHGGSSQPIDFWYCTATENDAAFPPNLESLCEKAGVTLHRMEACRQQRLNADIVRQIVPDLHNVNVWFCGPQGFAESLQRGLSQYGLPPQAFHYDRFCMR